MPRSIRVGKRDDLTFEARNRLVAAGAGAARPRQADPGAVRNRLEKAVQGDFGIQEGGGPVGPAVVERIIPSLELALLTLVISLPLAALLAVRAVRRGKRFFSVVVGQLSTVGFVMPQFWLGILLVIGLAVLLGWLPAGGYVSFRDDPVGHLERIIMPLLTLVIPTTALYFHFMRQSLRESLRPSTSAPPGRRVSPRVGPLPARPAQRAAPVAHGPRCPVRAAPRRCRRRRADLQLAGDRGSPDLLGRTAGLQHARRVRARDCRRVRRRLDRDRDLVPLRRPSDPEGLMPTWLHRNPRLLIGMILLAPF